MIEQLISRPAQGSRARIDARGARRVRTRDRQPASQLGVDRPTDGLPDTHSGDLSLDSFRFREPGLTLREKIAGLVIVGFRGSALADAGAIAG